MARYALLNSRPPQLLGTLCANAYELSVAHAGSETVLLLFGLFGIRDVHGDETRGVVITVGSKPKGNKLSTIC